MCKACSVSCPRTWKISSGARESGMTAADWLIVVVVLLNVVSAAMQGFFAEALSMAGLVVGYIVAAWQYQQPGGVVDVVFEDRSGWLRFSVSSSSFLRS